MAKRLKFSHEGKDYILEYTRQTVKTMEDRGFDPSKIISAPNTVLEDLFYGAFLANHKYVDRKVTEAIFKRLPNKESLVNLLSAMYNEPIKALMAEPDEGNAIQWEEI